MSHKAMRRLTMTFVMFGLTAIGVSAGIPGDPKNDQICGYGATWTSICNGMTTNCTSAGGTCQVCDTSSPWSGAQRKCVPQENKNCNALANPGLVNCGPRQVGVCVDNGSGGFTCTGLTSNGDCLTAGDLC